MVNEEWTLVAKFATIFDSLGIEIAQFSCMLHRTI
jgi:glycine cleavage system regulatory protein